MAKNPMKTPFMSPTSRGLHPHVVRETGQENSHEMYEMENDVFSAFNKGKDPLRGLNIPVLGQTKPASSGGIVGFIKENPIFSATVALGLGALAFKLLSGGDTEDDHTIDGVLETHSVTARVKNPEPMTTHLLPAPGQSQVYVQQEPIVIKTRETPPVMITMPSEKGVELSAPGVGFQPQHQVKKRRNQVKKRRRRHKPDRIQVRDSSGKFTSKTVKVK